MIDLDKCRESAGWLAMKGHMHEARQMREMADELALARDCIACLEHALDMGHFTEGGSTEGWAKRSLAAYRAKVGGTASK